MVVVDAIGIVVPPLLRLLSRVETLSLEEIRVEADVASCCCDWDGCEIPPIIIGFLSVVPHAFSATTRPLLLLVVDGKDVLPPPLDNESDTVLRSLG